MLNREVWKGFGRALTEGEIASVEGRLDFLKDVIPKYADLTALSITLDDLDLDLLTYLRSPHGVESGMTPWLVHCDWFGYAAAEQLSPEVKSFLEKVLAYAPNESLETVDEGLSLILAGMKAVESETSESNTVVYLSVLDLLATKLLVLLGQIRLRKLVRSP